MEKVVIKMWCAFNVKGMYRRGWNDGTLEYVDDKSFKIYPKKEWERICRFMENYKGKIRITRGEKLSWEPKSWKDMCEGNIIVYECDGTIAESFERVIGDHFGNQTVFNWLDELTKNAIATR